jgi:hypothetical protein
MYLFSVCDYSCRLCHFVNGFTRNRLNREIWEGRRSGLLAILCKQLGVTFEVKSESNVCLNMAARTTFGIARLLNLSCLRLEDKVICIQSVL